MNNFDYFDFRNTMIHSHIFLISIKHRRICCVAKQTVVKNFIALTKGE